MGNLWDMFSLDNLMDTKRCVHGFVLLGFETPQQRCFNLYAVNSRDVHRGQLSPAAISGNTTARRGKIGSL